METTNRYKKKNIGKSLLTGIEEVGNRLWSPITIFVVITVLLMVASSVMSRQEITAIHPGTQELIQVENMLQRENLQWLLANITVNFQSFPPLFLVIIVMLGVSIADQSGLLTAFLKNSVLTAPQSLVSGIIAFIGLNAVAAGDSGPIVLPPLAAAIFMGLGRNPLAGLFLAFASVTVGFTACVMVQMGDVIAFSFTKPAAQIIDPAFQGNPTMNYYFMFLSVFILMPVLVWINDKIVEPRLKTIPVKEELAQEMSRDLSDGEKKGLKFAFLGLVILAVLLIGGSVGDGAFLKGEADSLMGDQSILMEGIVPLVALFFLVPGLIYGITVGKIRSDKDIATMMGEGISTMGGYIALAFFASQMLGILKKSNIGLVLSMKGAEFLKNIGLTGMALFVSFMILTSFLNLFLGSAGAKWAIMAPIFVPMLMLMGYSPAFTQLVYRIGDSITNGITPLSSTFVLMIAYGKKYDKDLGVGTVIANMLPYTVITALIWILMVGIFMALDLPLGPGAGIYL